jgi:hypothetical protein
VNWVGKPVAAGDEKSVAGLTAGSSFQDYRIADVGITGDTATSTETDSNDSKINK